MMQKMGDIIIHAKNKCHVVFEATYWLTAAASVLAMLVVALCDKIVAMRLSTSSAEGLWAGLI